MKTKLFLLTVIAATLFSCQKEKNSTPNSTQDVVFSAIEVDPGAGLKNTADWECKDLDPDYAHVIIDGTDYYPEVFRLDGVLYTQAIKLPVGSYNVTQFLLMDDNGTPGVLGDDEIVMGTPVVASDYAVYVTKPVDFDFNVLEFTKLELDVEVLCFQDAEYDSFGFDWFQITEIIIREQCFFGDICLKHVSDYEGSLYEEQSTGLQIDMPAIVQVVVKKDGVEVPGSPFTNATVEMGWGVGQALCVQYPDNLNVDGEEFTFELKILVKVGAGFQYVSFHTFTFEDDEMVPAGQDGVIDFVLGNCNLTEADLELVPYQNLPATCTLTTGSTVPGVVVIQDGVVGYFDVTLSGIGAGYDIANGVYGVNCFNQNVSIGLNTVYNMTVHSSLRPEDMQPNCANLPWDKANWIINHLDQFSPYNWYDIQQALWMLEDPLYNGLNTHGGTVPAITAAGLAMVAGANANGSGYTPLPGGWAAVAFDTVDGSLVQCIFTRVDP